MSKKMNIELTIEERRYIQHTRREKQAAYCHIQAIRACFKNEKSELEKQARDEKLKRENTEHENQTLRDNLKKRLAN